MFERFTPRARRVVVLAQDVAREMGHARIQPEHLLIGLHGGEGMAAHAMAEAGVDGAALRQWVVARYASTASAMKIDRVPFSVDAKQCMEQSLRAALALGHSYIGTEHLFFGVQHQAEASRGTLDAALGVSGDDIARRLTEMLGSAGHGAARRSPALRLALDGARLQAGESPITTGHVLTAMLADAASQAARALADIGLDPQAVQTSLDSIRLVETSDASPPPRSVEITIGATTTVLADAEVAASLSSLSPDQLRLVLKRALEHPDTGGDVG